MNATLKRAYINKRNFFLGEYSAEYREVPPAYSCQSKGMVFWRVELQFTWRNPTVLFFRKIFEMEPFELLEAIFGMMPNLTVHMKPKWPPVLVALDTDDHHTKKQGTVKSPSSWARPKPCRLYKYILAIKRLPKVLRNFDQYLKEDYPEKVKKGHWRWKEGIMFRFQSD